MESDYGYANARIRAMKSDLLDGHAYASLLAASNIEQIIELLARSAYKADIEATLVKRGGVRCVFEALRVNIARTVEPGYDTVGESVGFLKVARAAAPGLLAALQGCVEAGRDRIEHEDAYPIFLQQYVVGYERVDDLPWTEIDFAEDITRAERELLPLIDGEKSSDE